MISLKKLRKIIEQDFGIPFLPKGFVQVRDVSDIYKELALSIDIGDRNITIGETGEVFGAGTNVGEGVDWKIERTQKQKVRTWRKCPYCGSKAIGHYCDHASKDINKAKHKD